MASVFVVEATNIIDDDVTRIAICGSLSSACEHLTDACELCGVYIDCSKLSTLFKLTERYEFNSDIGILFSISEELLK